MGFNAKNMHLYFYISCKKKPWSEKRKVDGTEFKKEKDKKNASRVANSLQVVTPLQGGNKKKYFF